MDKTQKNIKKFMEKRGWNNSSPADIAKSISIESAELLEHFQWKNFSLKEINKDPNKKEEISLEVADIMIYCLSLLNDLDLDGKDVIEKKLKKASEKYPEQVIRRDHKKYLEIKKEYRKKHA